MSEQDKMWCWKCRWPRSFYLKWIEAYCGDCGTFLWIAWKIKDLVKYRGKYKKSL